MYTNRSTALDAACTPGSARGLHRLLIERSARSGEIRFHATGALGAIPTPVGAITARLILGSASDGRAGRCGERTFAELGCQRNPAGTTIVCR